MALHPQPKPPAPGWPWGALGRRGCLPLALIWGLVLGGCWSEGAAQQASPGPSGALAARRLSPEEAQGYLRAAARAGELEVLVGLAEAGVPLDQADARGHTPLVLAAYHGHLPLVRYLVEHGAQPCRENGWGQSALMGAAFKGHLEVVRYLAPLCPVDQTDPWGRTALAFAIVFGRRDVAAVLRQMGAKEPSAAEAIATGGPAWQGAGEVKAEPFASQPEGLASPAAWPWGPKPSPPGLGGRATKVPPSRP